MSVKVMHLVWEYDCPPTDKLVLLKMADCGDDEGENIYPTKERVANAVGCTPRTVQTIWRKLEKDGILHTQKRGLGRGNTTIYRLDLEALKGENKRRSVKGEKEKSATLKGEATNLDTTLKKSEEPLLEEKVWPERFLRQDFEDAWRAWQRHRNEINKPLSETAITRQVNQLRPFSVEEAIAFIDRAITNGWQGLVYENDKPKSDGWSLPGGAA